MRFAILRTLDLRPSDSQTLRLQVILCQSFISLMIASIRFSSDFQAESNSDVSFSFAWALK